jgi:hypothetical protein
VNENAFEDWYNSNALNIWHKYGHSQKLVPLLIPQIETNIDILFVGMNPSHRADWISKQLENNRQEFNNHTIQSLFNWDETSIFEKIPYIKLMEQKARTHDKQYYGALDKFTKECAFVTWTHLDVFLVRETNQNIFLEQIEYNKKNHHINEFGLEQIQLFKGSLDKINPKIIVINNATTSFFVSRFLLNKYDVSTSVIYKNKPIFFSGMLSGQRSLDRFSRARLINEIKYFSNTKSK